MSHAAYFQRNKIALRQCFTEALPDDVPVIQEVFDLIYHAATELGISMTPPKAYSQKNFKKEYEIEAKKPFTPENFWQDRSAYISQADLVFCVRTSLSESTAAEVFYDLGYRFAQTGKWEKDKFHFLACQPKGEVRTTMLKQFNIINFDPGHIEVLRSSISTILFSYAQKLLTTKNG